MSFLIEQDTAEAWVRGVPLVRTHFPRHQGGLYLSTVTVMGLELWLLHPRTPGRHMQTYAALMQQIKLLNVDDAIAHQAALVGNTFRNQGQRVGAVDLLLAATALVHGLTVVTHSPQVYAQVPGLTLTDWLTP
jgi:tRNA(fMet)-specific endonuclease VapC